MSQYKPPPGPPPAHPPRLPLNHIQSLPFDIQDFAVRGWVSIPLRTLHPSLYEAYQQLFRRAKVFFDLPDADKHVYHIPADMQTSEEGYSLVQGEKQLLTLRRGSHCPPEMRAEVERVWREGGEWMANDISRSISKSVGMTENAFDQMTLPCVRFPKSERVATLLRMFRYDRPKDSDNEESWKVVSEGHRDLGLLTLVVGESPGLEVWDTNEGTWVSIEQSQSPKTVKSLSDEGANVQTNGSNLDTSPLDDGASSPLTVTLLSGQTLARLTNNRFSAGRHRVLVHPPSPTHPSPYRFSLVHALRAHLPVLVSSSQFTTPLTGSFDFPFERVTMGAIYKAISDTHFNVNIDPGLREEQRRKLRALNAHASGNTIGLPSVRSKESNAMSNTDRKDAFGKKDKRWSIWRLFKRALSN